MMTVIGKTDDAEILADKLKCKLNNYKARAFIRYGVCDDKKSYIELNKTNSIELARHKFYSLDIFRINNIPVVKYNLTPEGLNYPLLARKFYHSRGTDIQFIENESRIIDADYYLEFKKIQDEFRFHVFNNRIISMSIKYGGNVNSICRNLKTGWSYKEIPYNKKINYLIPFYAIKSVQCLGLDFGAVDIMVSENKPYILEVNTSMGLDNRRAEIYANNFRDYINNIMNNELMNSLCYKTYLQ